MSQLQMTTGPVDLLKTVSGSGDSSFISLLLTYQTIETQNMKFPCYQVDAFSRKLFGGNPAAVVIHQGQLNDGQMQAIATENNLAETAFVRPDEGEVDFQLRWFTPSLEIDLCGHATLAAAFVIFETLDWSQPLLSFNTRSGILMVRQLGDQLQLDFPVRPAAAAKPSEAVLAAIGVDAKELVFYGESRDILIVLSDQQRLLELNPDFRALEQCTDAGVIVSSAGINYDFVSRFFAPSLGVDEDPVTGSAHCTLVPYWAESLGKNTLTAKQLSARGGEVGCELKGGRVLMSGAAVMYLRGEISL